MDEFGRSGPERQEVTGGMGVGKPNPLTGMTELALAAAREGYAHLDTVLSSLTRDPEELRLKQPTHLGQWSIRTVQHAGQLRADTSDER